MKQSPLRRPWWDTRLARQYGAEGLAAKMWLFHFFPGLTPIPANDRDHIPW